MLFIFPQFIFPHLSIHVSGTIHTWNRGLTSSPPIDAAGNGSSASRTRAFDACASELLEAGIQFEKISHESHLLKIRFDRGYGVIKIPTLSINETESLLRSLISLEQCGFNNNSSCESFHVSSYALLLKSLIRSSADVQLLQEKGIIISDLEKGGSVLALISSICKNIHVKHHFYFDGLCKEVNTYYKSR